MTGFDAIMAQDWNVDDSFAMETPMGMAYAAVSNSSIRSALKRGLARQTIARAAEADLAQVFRQLGALRPNRKAQDRVAQRLQTQGGVVRVTMSDAGMVIFLNGQYQSREIRP
jgi:hypothetical protein